MAPFAGADALTQVPEIAQWLTNLLPDKTFYIASLIYLDGEKYVRASVAMDAIIDRVTKERQVAPGLLYIDTPSHAQLVPASCKQRANEFRQAAPWWQKLMLCVGILKLNKFQDLAGDGRYLLMDCLAEF